MESMDGVTPVQPTLQVPGGYEHRDARLRKWKLHALKDIPSCISAAESDGIRWMGNDGSLMHKHDILMLEFPGSSNGPFFGGFFHSSQLGSSFLGTAQHREGEGSSWEDHGQGVQLLGSWEIGRIPTVLPQVPPSFDGYIMLHLLYPHDSPWYFSISPCCASLFSSVEGRCSKLKSHWTVEPSISTCKWDQVGGWH